jgi:hypothetical protein
LLAPGRDQEWTDQYKALKEDDFEEVRVARKGFAETVWQNPVQLGSKALWQFSRTIHAIYLSCGFIIRTFQYNKIWTIHGFPYLKVRWDQRKIVVPGFTYFKL